MKPRCCFLTSFQWASPDRKWSSTWLSFIIAKGRIECVFGPRPRRRSCSDIFLSLTSGAARLRQGCLFQRSHFSKWRTPAARQTQSSRTRSVLLFHAVKNKRAIAKIWDDPAGILVNDIQSNKRNGWAEQHNRLTRAPAVKQEKKPKPEKTRQFFAKHLGEINYLKGTTWSCPARITFLCLRLFAVKEVVVRFFFSLITC